MRTVNKINAHNSAGILFFHIPLLADHANNFIQTVDPKYPRFVFAKWKTLNRQIPNRHNRPGIDILYGSYTISDHSNQQFELFLYRIPQTLSMEFLVSQLEMPTSIDGVIVIIDATPGFMKERTDITWADLLSKYRGDVNGSPVTWARMNNLPFTVVLIQSMQEAPMISEDSLKNIYELNEFTPIITCPPEFGKETIDEILSISLMQIQLNMI